MIYNKDFFKNKYPNVETYDFYISDDLKQIIPDNCFYELYRLSGREGNSCWNDDDKTSPVYYNESIKELDILDTVIEDHDPDISYLKYKKIMKELKSHFKTDTHREYEYYGNETTYEILYIDYQHVFEILDKYDIL